jgi:hypothetical protein
VKRKTRIAVLAASGLLFAVPLLWPPRDTAPIEPSLALRLLGPVANWAAAAQWVRVDAAIRSGRTDVALRRAETALAIDPRASSGWIFLARHLAFDLASVEREPAATRRSMWVRTALAVLERGEATADDRAELVFWQGLFDDEMTWSGGRAGLWLDAAARFERAASLGHPFAAELARRAHAEAELASH